MPRVTATRERSHPRVTRIFLFTDLREYTRFVETHGDVAATRLLRDYRTIVRREVARTRGAEIKTEGDSFYIVFEAAVPALDCAVAILEQVNVHNEKLPARRLDIGAGLHAGDAVEYDGQYVGGAVIVASRLSTKAASGELLVSDTVRGLVRTGQAHLLRDRGTVTLKGVSEPIRVWSVAPGEAAAGPVQEPTGLPLPAGDLRQSAPSGHLVCPILVGRESELNAYRRVLEEAVDGRGRLLFVSGEPGVGKSAFVREAVRVATPSGYRILPGAAVQWERGLPYAPFLSALRAGFVGPALRDVVGRAAPDIGPLLPELGQAGAAADSPIERHRIARSFTELFQAIARQAPLLLVLEDLHWVDEASIALLQHLARAIQQHPVVVLATYRSDEVHRRHPLSGLVADLTRARLAVPIPLDLLGTLQIDELVRATLDGAPIGREILDAIYARSEGNPFFAEELLKSLVESGAITRGAGDVWQRGSAVHLRLPETLRDLVLSRLERLGDSARLTLAAASVIGGRFGYETLRSVRAIDEAALTADLRQAIDEQFLVEQREQGPGSFAFRHALGREVIYDDLLLPERQRLHLLVGEALVARSDAPPALVAQHWSAGGDRRRAAEAYEAAGNAALSVNAASEAVAGFEAAISASDRITATQYLGLARAYLAIDHLKARGAAERGLALLDPTDDVESRVTLMRIAGRSRWFMGDAAGNFELARAAVDLVAGLEDGRAKADAFDWYANAHVTRGDDIAAREWAERALAVARSSGARAIAANALITIASCEAHRSPVTALALIDEAAAIARGAAAAEVLARAHMNGIATSFQAEPERRRFIRLERATEFARRYGYGAREIAAFRAFHEFSAGRWPAGGLFDVAGDAEADLYVAWVRLLEALMDCARQGPTEAALARVSGIAARAVRQDEPQFALPWISHAALAQSWAGRPDEMRTSMAVMLSFADRTADPARSLTLLCRGFPWAATVLLLARERERLEAMARAFGDPDGHEGERELVEAFLLWLAGQPVDAPLGAAAAALEQRGFGMAVAFAIAAMRAIRPEAALPEGMVSRARDILRDAQATWLEATLATPGAS